MPASHKVTNNRSRLPRVVSIALCAMVTAGIVTAAPANAETNVINSLGGKLSVNTDWSGTSRSTALQYQTKKGWKTVKTVRSNSRGAWSASASYSKGSWRAVTGQTKSTWNATSKTFKR